MAQGLTEAISVLQSNRGVEESKVIEQNETFAEQRDEKAASGEAKPILNVDAVSAPSIQQKISKRVEEGVHVQNSVSKKETTMDGVTDAQDQESDGSLMAVAAAGGGTGHFATQSRDKMTSTR